MSADCAPQVTALWTSCAYQKGNHNSQIFRGVPVHHLAEATAHLRTGVQPPCWRTLGALLEPISMAAARRLGVPDDLLDASAPALADAVGATADGAVASTHGAVASTHGAVGSPNGSAVGIPGADGVEEAYGEAGGSVLCVSHVTAAASHGAHDGASRGNRGGPIDELGGARGSSGELGGGALRGGDLLLSIDGVPIRSLLAADEALQGKDEVTVQLVSELDAWSSNPREAHSSATECLPACLSECHRVPLCSPL